MRVLITGTAGVVGAATVLEFLEHGYEVRGLDRHAPKAEVKNSIENVYADLSDRLALLRAVEGCDAIVHLAAIPYPGLFDDLIFQTNVLGTQYLFAAAEAHGIKRFALASTCCAFGIYYAMHRFDPQYLPVNEVHPDLPQDLYALSKVLNEETARAYTRRCDMSTVALRLTSVVDLDRVMQRHPEWARRRLQSDEHRENDLWSYIDIRDSARAFRLAIENAAPASNNTVIIAARDSHTAIDIREQVKKHFPALAESVADLDPKASLYDTTLAESAIGFVAEKNWREYPGLEDLG